MTSIAMQDYDSLIEHIIVGDGCPFLLSEEKLVKSYYERLKQNIDVIILHEPRRLNQYVWERVASHINTALDHASGEYIVNLDDDDTIAPNHLSSLKSKISQGYDAVYCWRYLFHQDGTPYLLNQYPWIIGNDLLRANILFTIQSKGEVFALGQNMVKDTLYLNYKGITYCTVDASEWILRKELFTHNGLKFIDDFSYTDILYSHCEDYLFGTRIKELNLKVGCTNLPTLNYYLSGNSQDPENV
jgi:glycosyltransferase involved in cell wall biosynthesis